MVSNFAEARQTSHIHVRSSNFSPPHAGHFSGTIPFPEKPHLLHVHSSWILLQGVGMWSASISKIRSAPSQPFFSISASGSS